MITKATPELTILLDKYYKIFPSFTFPYIPFAIAALFQSLAWTSGSRFLYKYSLVPRILLLFILSAGEYLFMSPAINAGVEVKNMDERNLVVKYQVVTLIVFMMVSIFIYEQKFELEYGFAFLFAGLAVYCANS